MANNFKRLHHRVYLDGSESGSTPLTNEDATAYAATNANRDVTYHYREGVSYQHQNGGIVYGSGTLNAQLEYAVNTGGGYGAWTTVNGSSSYVRSTASSNVTDGGNTTNRATNGLTDPTFTPGVTFKGTGQIDEVDGQCAALSIATGEPDISNMEFTECLFSFQFRSADITVSGTKIKLRVTDAGAAFNTTGVPADLEFTFTLSSGGSLTTLGVG